MRLLSFYPAVLANSRMAEDGLPNQSDVESEVNQRIVSGLRKYDHISGLPSQGKVKTALQRSSHGSQMYEQPSTELQCT